MSDTQSDHFPSIPVEPLRPGESLFCWSLIIGICLLLWAVLISIGVAIGRSAWAGAEYASGFFFGASFGIGVVAALYFWIRRPDRGESTWPL
jgi:hypothetical protein